jgi:glycosyltransferase involved in cell wall biosynthesis
MVKIPIVIKVWAGTEPHDFRYITRSLPSLLASELPEAVDVLVFDDCSTDPRLRPFLLELAKQDRRVRLFLGDVNKGPNKGQADAYALVEEEYPDAPYYLNLDDDVVYHRRWLSRLLEARESLRSRNVNGIFTALNMPFRAPHGTVRTPGGTCLLKWKQPALNWLIPREVYQEVGSFTDEGIAYDTAYSHWLRLNGYPVICLTPSLVQNVGTFGAYSRDHSTTSDDFLGEGDGDPALSRALHHAWRRVARPWRRQIPDVAPIRWGAEWVYERRIEGGKGVAVFRYADAERLGGDARAFERRALDVQRAQGASPVSILGLQRGRRGAVTGVECAWSCLPNLNEARKYRHRYGVPDPTSLLLAICRDLTSLHEHGVVHNKLRATNLYVTEAATDAHLAWYGTEPPTGRPLLSDRAGTVALFSDALDKRAGDDIRESCAACYLAATAPEVLEGRPATLRSDVFSAAALTMLSIDGDPRTLVELETQREHWRAGAEALPQSLPRETRSLLARCLSIDPKARPANALELRSAVTRLDTGRSASASD